VLPLNGIRIIDLSNVLSGPFCGYQLALMGAEVIKVEVPHTGDLARKLGADPALNARKLGASFLAQNANKKSVCLNLKQPAARAAFLKMVATADVVIENFRPGVMDRLGLGWTELKAANPGIIYCAISGFGNSGPLRDNPAYDQIVQGLSGVMSVTGSPDTAPLRAGFPVADTIGGLTAAMAISAALVRKARSGEGEMIDVSMLEATIVALGWAVSNYLTADQSPRPMGNDNMTASPSGSFATGDGIINIAANESSQYEALCGLIGRKELIDDPRFSDRERRKQNRVELREAIEASLATADAATWEARLNQAGVPAGRVLSIPEVLTHPQVVERGLVVTLPAMPGTERPVRVLRGGFRFASGDPRPSKSPPMLGADTREILGQVGVSEVEIDALLAAAGASSVKDKVDG
jgi:CoA:oxalate CoA-transferase